MSRKTSIRAVLDDWNARAMFTCHDMTRLISQAQDGDLPAATRWRMKLHFLLCVWCRRYRRQLGLLRRAFTRLPEREPEAPEEGLPADAKARLKRKLQEHDTQ
jgi:predicted anti-sigma-YlaC factor YlaD